MALDAQLVITSAHLPPMTLDAGGPAEEPSPVARALLAWLKPRFAVKLGGVEVGTFTPAGKPEASDWPLWGFLLGVPLVVGIALLVRRLVRR